MEIELEGEEIVVPTDLRKVLEKFSGVFVEPQGLPPKRRVDHPINLKKGIASVSMRPYRYPLYQKTEIEIIEQELLATGVIRLSQSSFSDLVG